MLVFGEENKTNSGWKEAPQPPHTSEVNSEYINTCGCVVGGQWILDIGCHQLLEISWSVVVL